ncbi:MAG: hypothetical protein J6S83_09545 [Lachnospiraceae bacterium]|nr:hypothetical protein [Lachnospiraceae bacterium]
MRGERSERDAFRHAGRGLSMKIRVICTAAAVMMLLTLVGCSRAAINYQIAESIGTVGMYENNEPVETPKMRSAREQQEAREAAEASFQEQLDHAQSLADGYWYDEAIAYLETLEKNELTSERINEAIKSYESAKSSVKVYEGKVVHLCFPGLIEDGERAFDGDDMAYTYSGSMITCNELRAILDQLYENGYVLVDIHDVAAIETDDRGISTMEMQKLKIPSGKKPIILSQDNLNYSLGRASDGIASKLVLEDGKVKALYTDREGHDLKGDYDFIPVLDTFIEEHPGFAYQGARGIVSVSGSEGVFGYDLDDPLVGSEEENQEAVSEIAKALRDEGWSIACAGYDHKYMNEMSVEQFTSDIENWMEKAGTWVGETDIMFYPYGAEVAYPSEQLNILLDNGFLYLCGLWGDTDYMELGEGYLRQTRRFVDGYTIQNAASYFTGIFDAVAAWDPAR